MYFACKDSMHVRPKCLDMSEQNVCCGCVTIFLLYSVNVNTLPLDIVLNSDTIGRVKNFFGGQQQHKEITSDWTEQLWLRLKELQAQTASEVRNQIEEMLLGEVSY